jgi:hypothetical protein
VAVALYVLRTPQSKKKAPVPPPCPNVLGRLVRRISACDHRANRGDASSFGQSDFP